MLDLEASLDPQAFQVDLDHKDGQAPLDHLDFLDLRVLLDSLVVLVLVVLLVSQDQVDSQVWHKLYFMIKCIIVIYTLFILISFKTSLWQTAIRHTRSMDYKSCSAVYLCQLHVLSHVDTKCIGP